MTTQATNETGGFFGGVLDLAGLYTDFRIAETEAELNAFRNTNSTPTGAEAVVDSDAAAARGLDGLVDGGRQAIQAIPQPVLIVGGILAAVGAGLLIKRLV